MIRPLLAAAVGSASIAAILWWMRGRYVVVTVDGTSMKPSYRPGDRLLVRRTSADGLRRGDVVVVSASPATSPPFGAVGDHRWVVKRIAGLPGQLVPPEVARTVPHAIVPAGQLILLGDNAANSVDSRTAGSYAGERVLGVVLRQVGR
ncbi:signal peptidase I [Kribbella voronezhensis]|uniref:Signal peptidase I n=1 Tax=Kribbella voronezhensis TaxID=2512212 RepID=A0A4R7SXH5_9ACTN|nr:S26 family signal peptidase [Kribbella voronezhensis]TDU83984.1 signal peptidase I [Kribbella voronezhensis]